MKRITVLALIALVGVFSAFSIAGTGYKVGDIADDFKLKNIDGKMVSLADFEEAKGFIVVFTCNTCPYSVANEDRLNALDAKYKSKGYPVIAVNPNDPAAKEGEDMAAMKKRALESMHTTVSLTLLSCSPTESHHRQVALPVLSSPEDKRHQHLVVVAN